jgi:hypothetical protein
VILAILNWTSGYWTPIASQAAIQTVQAMNKIVVQTAGAGMKITDKPNFTEWTARPPYQSESDDDDDDADETDLDRL